MENKRWKVGDRIRITDEDEPDEIFEAEILRIDRGEVLVGYETTHYYKHRKIKLKELQKHEMSLL